MTNWALEDLINTLANLDTAHPSTGMLSDLDDGIYRFRDRSPAVAEAYTAFQQARYAHSADYRNRRDETGSWEQAAAAGRVLAQALRDPA